MKRLIAMAMLGAASSAGAAECANLANYAGRDHLGRELVSAAEAGASGPAVPFLAVTGKPMEAELARKVARIKRPNGVSVKTALVYDGHLVKTVEADGYFDAVIDIRDIIF